MSEKKYINADYLRQFVMPIKDHTGKIENIILYKNIETAPAADVEEVRHGRIIKTGRLYPYCSVCDANLERTYFRFCPYCGAKMDEKENNNV